MGNGMTSLVVSVMRQLVVLLPAAWLLSLTGSINAVWWAFPIAEGASLLISSFFIRRIYKRKIKTLG
jgi:Na+-driven multidrug efflux pump